MQHLHLRREDYPVLYWVLKGLSLVLTAIGLLLLVDYYQPSRITADTVIRKEVDVSMGGKVSFTVFTYAGPVDVTQETYKEISSGMTMERHYSKWMDIPKGIRFNAPDEEVFWVRPENIYALDAFFAKLLLASLFTLVFVAPSFWMVAITLIDIVVLLVVSGLPFAWVFASGFLLAVILFVYSVARQPESTAPS